MISNILTRGSDDMVSYKRGWSEEEDQLLADKVIQYASKGRAQLEAFQNVAETINRTPAACGYRWNAKLRNVFQEDLQQAKKEQRSDAPSHQHPNNDQTSSPSALQSALKFLKSLDEHDIHSLEEIQKIGALKKENNQLKKQLAYFEQAYSHAFSSTKDH